MELFAFLVGPCHPVHWNNVPKICSSWITDGRGIAGPFDSHMRVEHLMWGIASITSGGHIICLQKACIFAAPGWPRFLWILISHTRWSGFNDSIFGPCLVLDRSISSRVFSLVDCWYFPSSWLVLLLFKSGSRSSDSVVDALFPVGFRMDSSAPASVSGDSGRDLAKIIRFTLAGVHLRRSFKYDSLSQGSHSSSTSIVSYLLRIQIILLRGASPGYMVVFGPIILSVPLHRTRRFTSWFGHMRWTASWRSPDWMTEGPTLEATWSASAITSSHVGFGFCKRICLTELFWPSLRLLVGWSNSVSSAANTWNEWFLWMRLFATCLANFRG